MFIRIVVPFHESFVFSDFISDNIHFYVDEESGYLELRTENKDGEVESIAIFKDWNHIEVTNDYPMSVLPRRLKETRK